jgi:capsular exopolysaccharide synthesis family protein
MELTDYLLVLRRRWWQVVLVAILTVGAALLAGVVIPPRYESSVTLKVTPPPATSGTPYESVLTAELLAKTYRQLIDSDWIARAAMSRLGLSGPIYAFQRRITVELIPDTELLQITASGRTARGAAAAATAVSDAAIAFVSASGQKDQVGVALPAMVPSKAVWPQPLVAGVGGLGLGMALGIFLALAFDYLGARIEQTSDIEEKVGLPVMGRIPHFEAHGNAANAFVEPANPVAEHFRHLRTSILYSMQGRKLRTLLVTSAEPAQGKTVIASNLAISLAKTGKRILLVDADLRRPMVHEFFGLPNGDGLSEFLRGGSRLEPLVRTSEYASLLVVTAGAPSDEPAELLGSIRLSDFLREARETADIVILDSPPAVTVTDSVVLAARADGVLLVVDRGQRLDTVRKAKATLARVGAHILGAAYNHAEPERSSGRRNHYYYYTGGRKAEAVPTVAADVQLAPDASAE